MVQVSSLLDFSLERYRILKLKKKFFFKNEKFLFFLITFDLNDQNSSKFF